MGSHTPSTTPVAKNIRPTTTKLLLIYKLFFWQFKCNWKYSTQLKVKLHYQWSSIYLHVFWTYLHLEGNAFWLENQRCLPCWQLEQNLEQTGSKIKCKIHLNLFTWQKKLNKVYKILQQTCSKMFQLAHIVTGKEWAVVQLVNCTMQHIKEKRKEKRAVPHG